MPSLSPRQGTYSIVARDLDTGMLGVAVQSHWFSVGAIVSWAEPGVGAVATQSVVEVSYGPNALELMRAGAAPDEALAQLVAADPIAEGRQVAVIGADGRVAIHTGASCIPFAGHAAGEQVCCQANMMASETVWPAMLAAYHASAGAPFAQRLLAALDAAEAEGGDVRGRQSAALLVVPADGPHWETAVSLRVEDHPEPLSELRRLLVLHDAYALADQGDELSGLGRHDEAAALYRRAAELAPQSDELRFWAGVGAAQAGDLDTAVQDVRAAIAIHPGWRDLLGRIPPEFAPAAPDVLARLNQSDGRAD
ncbi:MAG: DUF1028 domain-containing protein [Actinomycetota bacterium]|nr:DUF1028 domain-containing protein [Actinomycetota bacterium]